MGGPPGLRHWNGEGQRHAVRTAIKAMVAQLRSLVRMEGR